MCHASTEFLPYRLRVWICSHRSRSVGSTKYIMDLGCLDGSLGGMGGAQLMMGINVCILGLGSPSVTEYMTCTYTCAASSNM